MRLNMIHNRTLPREEPLTPSDQTPVLHFQLPSFPLRPSSSSSSHLGPFPISTELVSTSASNRASFVVGGGGRDSNGGEEGFDEGRGDVGTVVGGVDGAFFVGVGIVAVWRMLVVGGRIDFFLSFSSRLRVVRRGFEDWKGRERERRGV